MIEPVQNDSDHRYDSPASHHADTIVLHRIHQSHRRNQHKSDDLHKIPVPVSGVQVMPVVSVGQSYHLHEEVGEKRH